MRRKNEPRRGALQRHARGRTRTGILRARHLAVSAFPLPALPRQEPPAPVSDTGGILNTLRARLRTVETDTAAAREAAAAQAQPPFSAARLLHGFFWQSPTIARALGLALLVGGTATLKGGLLLAVAFGCTAAMVYPVFALFSSKITDKARLPVLFLLAGAVFCAVRAAAFALAPNEAAATAPYLTLCAVSAALFWREDEPLPLPAGRAAAPRRMGRAFVYALRDAAGLALSLVPFAFVRELVGAGRVWGMALGTPAWRFWALPPGGFVLLGLCFGGMAALRAGKTQKEARADV